MNCLICSGSCSTAQEKKETPPDLLGGQLKAVFVLRELLRLPPEKLSGFMERSGGDHPHEWIRFCDPCQLLVEGAFSLLEQKVKIYRKLKKVQQEVILKVKESQREGGKDVILEETREFVRNHEYGAFEDPFVTGDWEAEWRMEQRKAVPIQGEDVFVKLEEEEDPESCDNVSGFGADDSDEDKVQKGGPAKLSPRRKQRKSTGNSKNFWKGKVEPGEMFTDASGQTIYRCLHPNCSKEFTSRKNLYRHKPRHQRSTTDIPRETEILLTCDLCQLTCVGPRGLKMHRTRVHPEHCERPFPCPECPVSFASAESRSQHLRKLHRGGAVQKYKNVQKRRQCAQCPYSTTKVPRLEAHVKEKHEGQRAFTCEVCGTGVSREDVLRHHQALHSICGVTGCRAQLQSKESLHAHDLEVHGKEVNVFRCETCGEFVVGRKNFERHQQLKHPPGEGGDGQQHICEQCGKSFTFERYLKYHVSYTHNKTRQRNAAAGRKEAF